jgi:hypothetical protein
MMDLEDAIDYIKKETQKYSDSARTAAIDVMNLHTITSKPAHSRSDGIDVGKHAAQATRKILNILEVKLNKLLQRKSEVINENKGLKAQINHFRRLRLQTDATHAKFEDNLRNCKESIEIRLSEATQIIEERDKVMEKKEALERTNLEEQRSFEEEYEEKGEFVKRQNKALDEALLKERKENVSDKLSKTANSASLDQSIEAVRGVATLEEEIKMAGEVGSLNTFVKIEQNSLSGVQDQINTYEMIFEQLKKLTGTDSLKEVVSTYMAHEEEMFSLYNYIQTVNAEIDQTVDQSYQTEREIKQYREQQKQQEDQRESILADLRSKLQTTLEATQQADEQNKQYLDSVSQISKKVGSLFYKLQCDQMDAKAQTASGLGRSKGTNMTRPESKIGLLTAGQTVSESNVLDYMGCIEQRALDIISDYLRATSDTTQGGGPMARNMSPTPGPSSPMHWPSDPTVAVDDFSDDDILGDAGNGDADTESKPVDLAALKEKMKKKLSEKQVASTSKHGTVNNDRSFRGR